MRILRDKPVTLIELLPEHVMSAFAEIGTIKRYKNGQIIQERGDRWRGLSIVRSGQAVAGNYGDDGKFLVSVYLREGECFGEATLFLDSPRTHGIWAQGETKILRVEESRFLNVAQAAPEISTALLKMTLLRNQELLEFMDTQRRLSTVAIVARLLFSAADSALENDTIDCRHEDIAYTLGLSRVAVGKALKKLQAAGLVVLEYGRIVIPDVKQLEVRVSTDDPLYSLQG